MSYDVDDSIAAIASARGSGARGIIRLSGPNVVDSIDDWFDAGQDSPAAKTATDSKTALDQKTTTVEKGRAPSNLRSAHRTTGSVWLDPIQRSLQADLYVWPDVRSYTGQPSAELHTVGSPPLLELALQQICGNNIRLARPGEFTLRAFLAGRLDLPQAEAVLGVIDATSDRQFDAALAQLSGGLSGPLNRIRDQLLNLLADLEAGLDFVEEDIQFVSTESVIEQLGVASTLIESILNQLGSRTVAESFPRVCLIGQPNAGKSTLWNALLDNEGQAITSDIAGTTRDYLVAQLDLDGVVCNLVDTAGIVGVGDFGDEINSVAEERSFAVDAEADLVLLCVDSSRDGFTLSAWETQQLRRDRDQETILVFTKADVGIESHVHREVLVQLSADSAGVGAHRIGAHRIGAHDVIPTNVVSTSAVGGRGLVQLRAKIREALTTESLSEHLMISSTATRCGDSLRDALESVSRAVDLARAQTGDELVSAEIRVALDELGRVVGAVYTDDVLDRIFSRFCIGK